MISIPLTFDYSNILSQLFTLLAQASGCASKLSFSTFCWVHLGQRWNKPKPSSPVGARVAVQFTSLTRGSILLYLSNLRFYLFCFPSQWYKTGWSPATWKTTYFQQTPFFFGILFNYFAFPFNRSLLFPFLPYFCSPVYLKKDIIIQWKKTAYKLQQS